MAISHLFGLLLLLISLLVMFKQYFALVIGIFVIGFVIWILIRVGADLFWWGKDKGKW